MIARPLPAHLDAVWGRVDLMVLQPRTLEALKGTLAEAARMRALATTLGAAAGTVPPVPGQDEGGVG